MEPREAFERFLAPTSSSPDGLEVASAQGPWIVDAAGRRYLDWLAGISVCHLGHRHPAVVEAVRGQLDRYLHVMVYGEYVQRPQVGLAEALARAAPVKDAQVYFTSSGAEAVEAALKTARKATGRTRFAAFELGYHGDTTGALSVTGREELRRPFGPLLEARFLPYGDASALAGVDRETAAVIVEPVQAEGGVRVPPDGFLAAVRRRCDETGALLIADEVQTGFGRTGDLWGSDRDGVKPDLMVLAKALGGGLPLGALVGRRALLRTLAENPPLGHLTTFGGHPLSCAAGLAALAVVLEGAPARNAAEQGGIVSRTFAALVSAGVARAARGRGLLLGLELASPARARRVTALARANGLLVGGALHDEAVLRIVPPLTMRDEELVKGLEILTAAVADAAREEAAA